MMDLYTAIKFASVGDVIKTESGKRYVAGSMIVDGRHVPAVFEEGHEEEEECYFSVSELLENVTLHRR